MLSDKINTKEIMIIVNRIITEINNATKKYGPFMSAHEGYAVMLEEVDELWDEVKKKQKKHLKKEMKAECIQIAACAIRFITDCCIERNKR